MSFILLGVLNSQAAGPSLTHYASLLNLGAIDELRDIAFGSADDAYVVGLTDFGGGARSAWILKVNTDGVIQWSRILSGSGGDYGYGIGVDGSDNVYIILETGSTGLGGTEFGIAKYNSSGVLQWQRSLGTSANNWGYHIEVDASGNSYVVGRTGTGTGSDSGLIAKYNSSGVIQWQRTLGTTYIDQFNGVTIDSSGNAYVSGTWRFANSGSATDGLIAKYNSSGVLQWQRGWGNTSFGNPNFVNKIAVDSNDNVYAVSQSWDGSPYSYVATVAKITSAGNLAWQRKLRGTSGTDSWQSAAVDADNNLYLVGNTLDGGLSGNNILMAKYDSSGVIQWQRIYGSSNNDNGYGVGVDSAGSFYVTGMATPTDYMAILNKFPTDGSGTGSFVLDGTTYSYQASSLNEVAAGQGFGSISLTDAAGTHTDQSSSLTDSVASATQYIETF